MIPDFDIHGVIPPVRPGAAGHSADRAPYPTTALGLCERFGGTAERRAILRGLLDLRAALAEAGLAEGVQWLDGSFAEDVERLRDRAPADIDVVTFALLGSGEEQLARLEAVPQLFDHDAVKTRYRVDHYLLPADGIDYPPEQFVRVVAYWSSMWSHQRRSGRWKGYVSIPLASNDVEARAWLDSQREVPRGTP